MIARHVIWWLWAPARLAVVLATGTVALLLAAAMMTVKRSWWRSGKEFAQLIRQMKP